MRKKLFCGGWEFSKNPIGTDYSDSLDFMPVDIPHDYLIYDTNNLYETSTGWYRKSFTHTLKKGMRAAVRFDGVYMDCKVYVNGGLAGEWKYGYTTFELDITNLLKDGENLITVRIDYREPNSRWYSGAGIYRNVWFLEYNECHITNDGVYISADVYGNITVTTEAERPEDKLADGLSVRTTIMLDDTVVDVAENACCACDTSRINKLVVKDGCKYSVNTQTFGIIDPELWDIDDPILYTCVTELTKNGEVIDTVTNRFGFRKAEFTANKGFFLNGRHIKLHGCCEHHDLGCLGAAVNKTALRRKLLTLRTMGVNAIRTSHNPPAPELMELADELGFLIISEGFDMWERSKTEYDYAKYFGEWIEKDVASWIRRDRNHPSVIAWSIGNEIYDTHVSERGQEVTSLLLGLVRENDPRENGYVTIGSNYMQSENAQKCADILKLAGYNYAERLYEQQHKEHPDWMIYGSETSSVVQSRGIYHFPLSQQVLCEEDEQCSALGNTSPGWAAKCTEACIIPDRDTEYCAGQFIWTGFDYIGEPTPYSTKNSYFGQFDTAGFAKDSMYIFKGAWTHFKDEPFVHIYPYWDFSEGQPIDIRVASNAPLIKLFFNGSLIAKKSFDRRICTELTLDTQLDYKPGELLAIAYDENGREIARDSVRSFGDTAALKLTPDKTELKADGEDLIFIDISAYDKNGEFVANANNRVFVSVSGAARLIGLDNGDSTDYEQYKSISRRLFSGKLLAVIAAKTEPGEINVCVSSPTLPDSTLTLTAVKAQVREGISTNMENTERSSDCPDAINDIPVRKIAFEGAARTFTPDRRDITFKTLVSPANASYADEIEYKITNNIGIPSNLAQITSSENGLVTVHCFGDGEFCLRALCKNGTDKYHILTALPLKGEGLGSAFTDAYSFVAGGLFTISENAVNGIHQGAGFAPGGGRFGFESVDFGKLGSDKIELQIYTLNATPISFRIYDGIPGESGEIVGEFTYHKPSAWLTYNEPEIFTLSKKLRGVHTICFESTDCIEIKGFRFIEQKKESAFICAADRENIYGDKFTVGEDEITGIGNNVVIDFGEFDFGEASPSAVEITGRSALAVNSIHLVFESENGQKREILEFEGSAQYTARRFEIKPLTEKCKVSFTFLPGSDFDFKGFKFI
ncbi:MAG: glycoside hydrolase family 2 TIM barrel-domain containing protein [Oscillospiraceae bacterium]